MFESWKSPGGAFTYEVYAGRTGKVTTASVMSHGKRYVGAAKCSPDDTYDKATGESIAMLRACRKVYQSDVEYYRQEVRRATFLVDSYREALAHYEKILAKSQEGLRVSKLKRDDAKASLKAVLDSTEQS